MEGLGDFLSAKNIIDGGIKFGGILMSLAYIIFLLIFPKQITQMKKVIDVPDKGWLLRISYVQLILAVMLFLYSLILL